MSTQIGAGSSGAVTLSEWNQVLRENFVHLTPSEMEAPVFRGTVSTVEVAHMRVAKVRSVPQRITRDQGLIRADGRDCLQIGVMRRGRASVSQDDRSAVIDAGSFVLYDTSREFDWHFEGHPSDGTWSMDVLTWPRFALKLNEVEIRQLTASALTTEDGVNALLGRFLSDATETMFSVENTRRAPATADGISELVGSVLRSLVEPPEPNEDLFHLALATMQERLSDAALSPADIAHELSISTRQLHRVFANTGATVSNTLRRLRLEQCRREIIAAHPVGRSLDQICHAWGISDQAVFSRAFKDEYGVPPSKYRNHVAGR